MDPTNLRKHVNIEACITLSDIHSDAKGWSRLAELNLPDAAWNLIEAYRAKGLQPAGEVRRISACSAPLVEAKCWTLELLERTLRTQGAAGPISREAFYDWGFQDTLAIGENRPGVASLPLSYRQGR